jgi:serine phosphatase RsbU (regulator of sigma subunit)
VLAEKRQLKEMKDIQEKQRKDLALKNNLVALQQKELALLKKAKELNQANAQRILLDKVRQEQALLISKGKLREANLAKAKTLATLEVERKEAEKRLQEKENQKHVALLNKEKKLQQQQIKQQKEKARYAIGIVILVVSILGLVLALLFVSNKNRQKLKKQKVQIEEQNSEIISQNEELQQQQEEIVAQRDNIEEKNKLLGRQNHHIQQSIKAALTIQDAILPEDDKIAELVPDNFILYRPKDVVSGDFYWGEKLGNKHILAAVDCTGHGVPGAFMSMIGSNLLNRIVLEQKVSEPKDILSQLNQEIEKVLRQKEKGYKNGMDLAIIVWEKEGEKTKLTFGGAKRHMYCFKNGDNTIQKVNASRYSIGYANPVFEQKSFVFEQGDTLYLSSDGYVDQNNVKRKKFGSRRFEAMLSENQHLPMPEQKVVISRSLDEFMGGVEQRDDILVIGVKF